MKKRIPGIAAGLVIIATVAIPILTLAFSTFDRNLELGMTGTDVKSLQILLNTALDTKLADSGPGSLGNETSYFGPLTKSAVIRFQEKYFEDVLAPQGFVSGTGFVDRATRQKLNSMVIITTTDLNTQNEGQSLLKEVILGDIPSGFTFEKNLSSGMSDPDVVYLKIVLDAEVDHAAWSGSDYFASKTKAAVVNFQIKYDSAISAAAGYAISHSGFVGTGTRTQLNALLAAVPAGEEEEEEFTGEKGSVSVEDSAGTEEKKEVSLTVNLVGAFPATSELVAGQAVAPLAKFTFTNNDAQEVKVTGLKFKRIGDSYDTTLTNVYLFEGTKRLTNGAKPFSNGVISFNDTTGIIIIPAGSSKFVTVKSDIATNSGNQTIGISIKTADDITSDASSLNGVFPINGSLMTIRSVTIAEVDFSSTTTPTTNTNLAFQNNYTVWQNTASIPTREVNFFRFSLKKTGSITSSDLRNFRLYVNGVQFGSIIENLDADDFITFDLSGSPKKIEIGYSTIKVSADIIGGSSKTFKFSLKTAADAEFIDTRYGVNVLSTANGSTFTARTSGTQTVSTGNVTITNKAGGPVDIVNGISRETLAEFTLTATGEEVEIESLEIEIIWTNDDSDSGSVGSLRNGILLANGVQVSSAISFDVDETSDGTGTTFNFGSSLTIKPGNPITLKVKADIYDNDNDGNDLENDDTLQVKILAGSNNAEALVSNSILSIPSTSITAPAVELEQGKLDLGKYAVFPNKTHVVPITGAKIAQFTLMSSKEAVDLNTITLNLATVTGAVDASDDLSNLYVIYGENSTSVKQAVVDGDNSWSINYRLEKHTTLDIMVYADVSLDAYISGAPTDTITPKLTVSGASVESGASAASNEITGQTITFGRGEQGDLTGQVAGDSPLDRIVAGSSLVEIEDGNPRSVIGAKYKFTAIEDDFLLKKIKLELDDGEDVSGVVLFAVLKDEDGNIIKDKNGNESKEKFGAGTGNDLDEVEFTGLLISIPANTTKTLTIDLILNTPNADFSPVTSQANIQLQLKKIKYENSLGEELEDSSPAPSGGEDKANNQYVFKSIPTFTHIDLDHNNPLYNGNPTKLYSFKVVADSAGDVSLKQLKFGLSWTDGDGDANPLELESWKMKRNSEWITGIIAIQNASGTSIKSTTGVFGGTGVTDDSVLVVTFDDEETILAGEERTYSLYAVPQGFIPKDNVNGADAVILYLLGDESNNWNKTASNSKKYLVDDGSTGLFALNTTNSGDGTGYNVIWSDNSSIQHSFSADNAYPDWANGYLVLNLPLDSEVWQGQ